MKKTESFFINDDGDFAAMYFQQIKKCVYVESFASDGRVKILMLSI